MKMTKLKKMKGKIMEKKNQRSLEDKCLSTYGEAEDVK
jgi:hypothetical protein